MDVLLCWEIVELVRQGSDGSDTRQSECWGPGCIEKCWSSIAWNDQFTFNYDQHYWLLFSLWNEAFLILCVSRSITYHKSTCVFDFRQGFYQTNRPPEDLLCNINTHNHTVQTTDKELRKDQQRNEVFCCRVLEVHRLEEMIMYAAIGLDWLYNSNTAEYKAADSTQRVWL